MPDEIPFYPIQIVQGDDFRLVFFKKVKDCETNETTPVDLSDVTAVECAIYGNDGDLLAAPTGIITDPVNGEITMTMTWNQTAALSGTDSRRPVEKIGRYFVRLIRPSTRETVLRGNVALVSVAGE